MKPLPISPGITATDPARYRAMLERRATYETGVHLDAVLADLARLDAAEAKTR